MDASDPVSELIVAGSSTAGTVNAVASTSSVSRANIAAGSKHHGREAVLGVLGSPRSGVADDIIHVEGHLSDCSTNKDEDEEDDYEVLRQRRIKENQLLFTTLGMDRSSGFRLNPSPSQPRQASQQSNFNKRQRKEKPSTIFDRSGYIVSIPAPGDIHRMVCVEMPSDRRLQKAISDGEYQDCSSWAEGEGRRWIFGMGRGKLQEGDQDEAGGIGEDFRWRKWKGLERELRKEMKRRGELIEVDARPAVEEVVANISAYSSIPGETCHQCRRKSDKLKMRCRNVDPVCRASFCETCCKRYSYFHFDTESRSFICPLCRNCCNCSNCIRKRNLGHLLATKTGGLRQRVREEGEGGMTVQAWVEKAAEKRMTIPFDRVRLVNQDEDVVSPDLPPEPEEEIQAAKGLNRRKSDREVNVNKVKKRKAGGDGEPVSLLVRLKIPNTAMDHWKKTKEVDSDGDTVAGWSDDDDAGEFHSDSSLTPSSSLPSPVRPRLAFPPRGSYPTQPDTESDEYFSKVLSTPEHLAAPNEQDCLEQLNQLAAQNEYPALLLPDVLTVDDGQANHPAVAKRTPGAPPHGSTCAKSVTDSTQGPRRRKPPPQAHIIRAPKHASLLREPVPAAVPQVEGYTSELNVQHHPPPFAPNGTYQQSTDRNPPLNSRPSMQSMQTYSYDGYHYQLPEMDLPNSQSPRPAYSNIYHPQFRPLSHSPRTTPQTLPSHPTADRPLPQRSASSNTWPQNLDLLSLAAAEARQGPSPDLNLDFTNGYGNPHRHDRGQGHRQSYDPVDHQRGYHSAPSRMNLGAISLPEMPSIWSSRTLGAQANDIYLGYAGPRGDVSGSQE